MQHHAELLSYLLNKNTYAKHIKVYQDQLAHIAENNEQIKSVLSSLLTKSNFKIDHEIKLSEFPYEKEVINDFFEYIYFASDEFLKKAR